MCYNNNFREIIELVNLSSAKIKTSRILPDLQYIYIYGSSGTGVNCVYSDVGGEGGSVGGCSVCCGV